MKPVSRRQLSLLLPALAAGASKPALPSKTYRYEDLPVRERGQNRSRAILDGVTHKGIGVECHETELAPGEMPHAAHAHVHEELVLIREGTLEVTIAGKTTTLGPGSVTFLASNDHHGWRNVGQTRARYYVITVGRESA